MPIRSYVDPCLYIVFIHVGSDDVTEPMWQAVEQVSDKAGEAVSQVTAHFLPRSRQVVFHERYHFWQGLRLPFMLRYAFQTQFKMHQAFSELARAEPDFHNWSCLLPELERLELRDQAGFRGSMIYWAPGVGTLPENLDRKLDISPLDLLECATSMAEFYYMTRPDNIVDPAALNRWAKRNPATLGPLRFIQSFLGDDSAGIRVCLPLINAAFKTSDPVRCFIELLARTWGSLHSPGGAAFLAQREPCRWRELFESFLDDLAYDGPPDSDSRLLGTTFHRLTLRQWAGAFMTDRSRKARIPHIILSAPAQRWLELERSFPELDLVLDFPHFVQPESLEFIEETFHPPLMMQTFHRADGSSRTLIAGNQKFTNTSMMKGTPPITFNGLIMDFMTLYGAVRRASGAHFDGDQRICHHRLCPEYALNYCNCYPVVPRSFEACNFRKRMKDHIDLVRNQHGDHSNQSRRKDRRRAVVRSQRTR